MEGMQFYNYQVCGPLMKEMWHFGNTVLSSRSHTNRSHCFKWTDAYRAICNAIPAVMFHGNFEALDIWLEKTLSAFHEIDLPASRDFASEVMELGWGLMMGICPTLVIVGRASDSAALLNSVGFTWSKEGFENHDDLFHPAFQGAFPVIMSEPDKVYYRLLVFLASPPGLINEDEVNAWIPTPAALAEMERGYRVIQTMAVFDLTSFAARVFLRLGRDDDAFEMASLAVASEQKTLKKTTLVTCFSILGQVAARRGEMAEADGYFTKALEEARLSRLPLLELIAARDWIMASWSPGRDFAIAEAAIDAACGKMNKKREQLAQVIELPTGTGAETSRTGGETDPDAGPAAVAQGSERKTGASSSGSSSSSGGPWILGVFPAQWHQPLLVGAALTMAVAALGGFVVAALRRQRQLK